MTTPTSTPARTPSRDDHGTTRPRPPGSTTCPVCAVPFAPLGRQQYCSTACRKTAFRRRHTPSVPPEAVPAPATSREHTVYQCGSCDSRLLGQQRCPDCGLFGTRLGLGGTCPCCDEIITLTDLDLTT